ncbi:uncharacterized protein LOC126997290 [Eriocheir sinensis]|uniref:uncharacterized protein LOC126997290 n=1 Tax=Eriocheir sinensis TaxID=95602 RepID=UPI0021C712E3|nr:uncharacterized protein LOC126997290 [Eriocheir sinensis]
MYSAARLIVWLALICLGEARECYNCTGDCVRFTDCKGSCFTRVRELGSDEIRSCIEETEETKCIAEIDGGEYYKTCYCNTERCNPATTPGHPGFLVLILITVTLLLRVR